MKKLILIALTVRLSVGNWMNCFPCLPTLMKDLAFSCHFEGFKGTPMQSHSFFFLLLPDKIDSLFQMDKKKKEKKKQRLVSFS